MKNIYKWIPIILLSGVILAFALKNTYYNIILKKRGTCVKAKVFNVYRTGRKGTMNIEYEFKVNDITYTNSDMGSDEVGDTISVVYLSNDPTINRPSNILHIDCNNHK